MGFKDTYAIPILLIISAIIVKVGVEMKHESYHPESKHVFVDIDEKEHVDAGVTANEVVTGRNETHNGYLPEEWNIPDMFIIMLVLVFISGPFNTIMKRVMR